MVHSQATSRRHRSDQPTTKKEGRSMQHIMKNRIAKGILQAESCPTRRVEQPAKQSRGKLATEAEEDWPWQAGDVHSPPDDITAAGPTLRQQAAFPPKFWPHKVGGKKGEPIQYVYRIMQQSGDDLVDVDDPIRSESGDTFKKSCLQWIAFGSGKRSPFWHASTTLHSAHKLKVCSARPAQKQGIAIRIDLQQWFFSDTMPDDCVIDVSTGKAQRAAFSAHPWEDFDMPHHTVDRALQFSREREEVLIKWRGTVPHKFCMVINVVTGEVLCTLEDCVRAVQKSRDSRAQLALSQAQPPGIGFTDEVVKCLTRESQAEKAAQKQAKAEQEQAALKKAEDEEREARYARCDEAARRQGSRSTSCNAKKPRTNKNFPRETERRPSSCSQRTSPGSLPADKPTRSPPAPEEFDEPEETASAQRASPWSLLDDIPAMPTPAPEEFDEPEKTESALAGQSPFDVPERCGSAWPRTGPFDVPGRPASAAPGGLPTQHGPAPQTRSYNDVSNAEQVVPRSKSLPDLAQGSTPEPVAKPCADHSPAQSVQIDGAEFQKGCSVKTWSCKSHVDPWNDHDWGAAFREVHRGEQRNDEDSKRELASQTHATFAIIRQI